MLAALESRAEDLAFGTIAHSLDQYRSKLKCWQSFCELTGAQIIPALEADVIRYVTIFRNPDSAKGYVSALRWAHDKCRVSISQFDTRALQQVLRGAQALMFTARRAVKDALLWDDVRKLVRVALRAGEIAAATEYVLASNFMFRVPSELLPLSYERCLEVDGGRTLQVELKRRKNRPQGSVLRRSCRCPEDKLMCPVHAVRELLRVQRRQRKGPMFFVTPAAFTKGLRRHAEAAGLVRAQQRCSHEFRRGTARELVKQGGTLGHIMKAGDWSSAAFNEYLDKDYIDQAALLEVITDQDSDDGAETRTAPPARAATAPASAARKRTQPGEGSRLLTEFFSLTREPPPAVP